MKKITGLIIITFIACYTSSYAQFPPVDTTIAGGTIHIVEDPKDTLHDYCAICVNHQHLIIKPPYTRKFKRELPFILTSAMVLGGGFLASSLNTTDPYTREELLANPPDINSINGIDRSSALNWSTTVAKASDYVLLAVTVLPAVFLSEHHTSRDIRTLLIMSAEVFAFNYGFTEIAKNLVNRSRPYVYNPEVGLGARTSSTSRKSFFSGHTSHTAAATFFFAKVITDYHPTLQRGLKIGVWIFAASIPATNGYLRVKAGKHFPTDVIAGYIAGAASGILIPQLHRTKLSKDLKEQINMGFMPIKGGMSMNLCYRF